MPAPRYRTHSFRKIKRRVPGGKVKIHYKKPPTSVPRCRICGSPLAGFGRYTVAKWQNKSHSAKRVNRPYGGNLCPNCLTKQIKSAIWSAYQ
ncbi:MAG: 50S ribosomal protein L34e [Candidatus Odinarchaeota archaeon]|nr:50S ribosomal protein L34e [Candidatus Odinarchaeota archaeon]